MKNLGFISANLLKFNLRSIKGMYLFPKKKEFKIKKIFSMEKEISEEKIENLTELSRNCLLEHMEETRGFKQC